MFRTSSRCSPPSSRRSADSLQAVPERARQTDYDSLRREFTWRIPEKFNIGVAASGAHEPDRLALVSVAGDGSARHTTYGELDRLSNRLANGLAGLGVGRGDRVGVVIPQSLETGLAHLAIWKLGAVSLPLASLFGPDALGYRLSDSGACLVLSTPENMEKVGEAAPDLPVVATGKQWDDLMAGSSDAAPDSDPTSAEDPAYLIYTSGTTGPPKGALQAHRSLHGHLPGFECYYELADKAPEGRADLASLPGVSADPDRHDVIWTPADWAWIGGLMDVLIPAWYFGMTVVTADRDFDADWAAHLMADQGVTLAFLPPTSLKMMRAAAVSRADDLSLRAVFSGGEPLGEEMLAWADEHLGVRINEGYGQTECNLVVGNCGSVWPVRPGSMGRAIPGHEVQVQDDEGNRLLGETGEICVLGPDPVMMLEYWGRPDATEDKYRGDWLLTGDLGVEDDDGYLWFKSRKDDVISSMGYRIGPGEIEESLMGHPAVAMCAVIGIPDEIRGQVPAAFVVPKAGVEPGDSLIVDLQQHVRTRLAAHEVPRFIEFVEDLPRTTTGKIMRRALRAEAVR
ncbi:MAG: AMP-binding protein [Actinobacteria bacterium]|nr:AMP-binding protein [Actinomycetota bacterium]